MSSPDVNASYHDLSSLHQLRATAKKDETAAIKQAAQQFESVFMGMLMQSMRKANASFEDDNPLNSQATEFFRDMHDSQMSAELSKKGALGLADLMVQQLAPQYSDTKAASQISPPSKFDIPKEKILKQPGDEQKMLPLPAVRSGFLQLDPERIVAPSAITLSAKKQLEPPASVNLIGNTIKPRPIHNGVQQLAAEVVVSATNALSEDLKNLSDTSKRVVTSTAQDAAVLQTLVANESEKTKLNSSTSANLDPSDPVSFIQGLLPSAKKAAAVLGIEPLALIAQAALETGWGQRMFKNSDGASSHNLFGIKAQANWQGKVAVVDTLEYRQGVAQKEKAKFRVYESADQSLQDYVDLIRTNPRYQSALAVANDTKAYFQQLQAAGYATDPNYAQKILSVMEGSSFKEVRKLLGIQ
jgi:flagellar protein FlgJ